MKPVGRTVLLLFISLSVSASANDSGPAPIATDRPAITNSSVAVPPGSLQFENGFASTINQGARLTDGPQTLVRYGLFSKTELRLNAPDYFDGPGLHGFGDLAVGLKQQLGPAPGGFDVSIMLTLSLPTGGGAVSSHGYDPSIQLPWSRAVGKNWTAAGMLSVYWPTVDGRRNTTGETTFLMDRQLTQAMDAFAEYAGDFPQQGSPRHLLHFGAAYKIRGRHQIDVHGGVGLSRAALDHFIAAGYSFRFQLLRRPAGR